MRGVPAITSDIGDYNATHETTLVLRFQKMINGNKKSTNLIDNKELRIITEKHQESFLKISLQEEIHILLRKIY